MAGLLLAMFLRPVADADIFWHIRCGEWMLEHRQILREGIFTFTKAGAPWLDHSWLAQVIFALTYRSAGFGGVSLLSAGLACGTFLLVRATLRGRSETRAITIFAAAVAAAPVVATRPHLFTLFFTALLQAVMAGSERRQRYLWFAPAIILIWANTHGGVAIGLLLLFVNILPPAGTGENGSGSRRTSRAVAMAVLCLLAACCTPWGAETLLQPFRIGTMAFLEKYVAEWQSPNFRIPGARPTLIFVLATITVVAASRRGLSAREVVTLPAAFALLLFARRNVGIFAVMVAPILGSHLDVLVKRIAGDRSWHRAARLTLCVGALIAFGWRTGRWNAHSEQLRMVKETGSPELAVMALGQSGRPVARMFNSYNFGAYLIWERIPAAGVFVDPRTDLYGDSFLTSYNDIRKAQPRWQTEFNKWAIDTVLLEPDAPLSRVLEVSPEWETVHQDSVASLFFRRAPTPNPTGEPPLLR